MMSSTKPKAELSEPLLLELSCLHGPHAGKVFSLSQSDCPTSELRVAIGRRSSSKSATKHASNVLTGNSSMCFVLPHDNQISSVHGIITLTRHDEHASEKKRSLSPRWTVTYSDARSTNGTVLYASEADYNGKRPIRNLQGSDDSLSLSTGMLLALGSTVLKVTRICNTTAESPRITLDSVDISLSPGSPVLISQSMTTMTTSDQQNNNANSNAATFSFDQFFAVAAEKKVEDGSSDHEENFTEPHTMKYLTGNESSTSRTTNHSRDTRVYNTSSGSNSSTDGMEEVQSASLATSIHQTCAQCNVPNWLQKLWLEIVPGTTGQVASSPLPRTVDQFISRLQRFHREIAQEPVSHSVPREKTNLSTHTTAAVIQQEPVIVLKDESSARRKPAHSSAVLRLKNSVSGHALSRRASERSVGSTTLVSVFPIDTTVSEANSNCSSESLVVHSTVAERAVVTVNETLPPATAGAMQQASAPCDPAVRIPDSPPITRIPLSSIFDLNIPQHPRAAAKTKRKATVSNVSVESTSAAVVSSQDTNKCPLPQGSNAAVAAANGTLETSVESTKQPKNSASRKKSTNDDAGTKKRRTKPVMLPAGSVTDSTGALVDESSAPRKRSRKKPLVALLPLPVNAASPVEDVIQHLFPNNTTVAVGAMKGSTDLNRSSSVTSTTATLAAAVLTLHGPPLPENVVNTASVVPPTAVSASTIPPTSTMLSRRIERGVTMWELTAGCAIPKPTTNKNASAVPIAETNDQRISASNRIHSGTVEAGDAITIPNQVNTDTINQSVIDATVGNHCVVDSPIPVRKNDASNINDSSSHPLLVASPDGGAYRKRSSVLERLQAESTANVTPPRSSIVPHADSGKSSGNSRIYADQVYSQSLFHTTVLSPLRPLSMNASSIPLKTMPMVTNNTTTAAALSASTSPIRHPQQQSLEFDFEEESAIVTKSVDDEQEASRGGNLVLSANDMAQDDKPIAIHPINNGKLELSLVEGESTLADLLLAAPSQPSDDEEKRNEHPDHAAFVTPLQSLTDSALRNRMKAHGMRAGDRDFNLAELRADRAYIAAHPLSAKPSPVTSSPILAPISLLSKDPLHVAMSQEGNKGLPDSTNALTDPQYDAPISLSISDQISLFIQSRPALHDAVLAFETVEFSSLLYALNRAGVPVTGAELRRFVDKQRVSVAAPWRR